MTRLNKLIHKVRFLRTYEYFDPFKFSSGAVFTCYVSLQGKIDILKQRRMNAGEVAKVYETILSIPWMGEPVKLDLKISRKQVLLLAQVIELGLREVQQNPKGVFAVSGKEAIGELSKISDDCLEKAGLTETSGKLATLQNN